MSIDVIIWFMTIYVAIEYGLARFAVTVLNKIDVDYFALNEDSPGTEIHRRVGVAPRIVEMLFDADLPAKNCSILFEVLIYTVRTMYILTIPLAIVLFVI